MKIIEINSINISYDNNIIFEDFSCYFEEGKFYTLLGPSGCGKTTLLRTIAGFNNVCSGDVLIDKVSMNKIPANKRPVNTVFQDYALFEHLNVFENVEFSLKLKKIDKNLIKIQVEEALELVSLSGFESRKINELSGGQKQRVAIARAIINKPKVLLLDEPLSALDYKLRSKMQVVLKQLQRKLNITFIFVTHDQEEALTMSDYIFLLNNGKIEHQGKPTDIYDEPNNRFVADFIGESNIISSIYKNDYEVMIANKLYKCLDIGFNYDEKVDVVIRPEDLIIVDKNEAHFNVKVVTSLFKGIHYELIALDEHDNQWLIHTTKKVNSNSIVNLYFDIDAIHVMKAQNE